MDITIVGYGLGLNSEGSITLVSTTLKGYNDVIKYAFQSFIQNEDSNNIGMLYDIWYMVYGIEIVSCVDYTAFQVASKVLDEEVEIELFRSLQRKAVNHLDSADVWTKALNDFPGRFDAMSIAQFTCSNEGSDTATK